MLPDIVRFIARTIVKLRNQGGDKEEFVELPNGQKRSFKSMHYFPQSRNIMHLFLCHPVKILKTCLNSYVVTYLNARLSVWKCHLCENVYE